MKSIAIESMDIIRKFTELEARVISNVPDKDLTPKDAVSMYLGLLLGKSLPIPPNPLNQVEYDYKRIYRSKVLEYLGRINEVYILDIDTVEQITYLVWEARYKTVHSHECCMSEAIDVLSSNPKVNTNVDMLKKLNALRSVSSTAEVFYLPTVIREEILESLKV